MKKINKPKKPEFFKLDTIENYKKLRAKDNKIIARWNYDNKNIKEFKIWFLDIFNEECAYCGDKVKRVEIDHYLPKSEFPYLSYCYDNYLLSCSNCNQKLKGGFFPKSLNYKNYGEEFLINEIPNIIKYEKENLLSKINDRIIEPSFDNIKEHLEFNVLTCDYKIINNSEIGKITNNKFFNRGFSERLHKISDLIQGLIEKNNSKDEVMKISKLYGQSFYYEKFYEFWKDFY